MGNLALVSYTLFSLFHLSIYLTAGTFYYYYGSERKKKIVYLTAYQHWTMTYYGVWQWVPSTDQSSLE